MITIHDAVLDGKRVTNIIDFPPHLKKYVKSSQITTLYDAEITDNISILNIPALTSILPFSWLTGEDIKVNQLDASFSKVVEIIRDDFKVIYPKGDFGTRLIVNEFKDNRGILADGYAILFSGGLDSTYSFFNNIGHRPRLIMIFGGDMSLSRSAEFSTVKEHFTNFANENGTEISYIETNGKDILNTRRITHDFYPIFTGQFWERLQHGIIHVGMTTPLSVGRFNHLLVASSSQLRRVLNHPDESRKGSIPVIDEKITWAHDLKLSHDGVIPRYSKIDLVTSSMGEGKHWIRVCGVRVSSNCSVCNKCLRTEMELLLSGVDPNNYGFHVDGHTFSLMKDMLEKGKLSKDVDPFWKRMQKAGLKSEVEIIPGLAEFYSWLKSYDLEQAKRTDSFVKDLYYWLPYSISEPLFKLLGKAFV